jgi:alpha-ribazole phosphatase
MNPVNVGASTLFLVRHARPLIEPGVCYGQLDMAAEAEPTRVCAQARAGVLPHGITVVCSPLQRCEQLAQVLIGLRADLAYKTDPRLKEMDFGLWEGQRWDAIDPAALAAWTDHFAHHATGTCGESVAQFMARVGQAFDALPPADQVWITHAGVIRAAQLLARGVRHVERADQWPVDAPKYGQWQLLNLQTA